MCKNIVFKGSSFVFYLSLYRSSSFPDNKTPLPDGHSGLVKRLDADDGRGFSSLLN